MDAEQVCSSIIACGIIAVGLLFMLRRGQKSPHYVARCCVCGAPCCGVEWCTRPGHEGSCEIIRRRLVKNTIITQKKWVCSYKCEEMNNDPFES